MSGEENARSDSLDIRRTIDIHIEQMDAVPLSAIRRSSKSPRKSPNSVKSDKDITSSMH
jgi:hypothetical protein